MSSGFQALVVTHKQAAIEERELVALNPAQCQSLLRSIADLTAASDLLILSTCNRTEFYYTAPESLQAQILTLLRLQKALPESSLAPQAFRHISDPHATCRHLTRVALGLESQIPGDLQIIHQVKEAYQWSADAGTAGPFLHRLLHTIFFANKRVVTETSFRTGAASVSYAAQELAEELLPLGPESRVLILGVGEMGANLAQNLAREGYANITIVNRTLANAQALANRIGAQAASLADLPELIADAHAIISCISAPEPVITSVLLKSRNPTQRLLAIDLSLPRAIAPEIESNPAVLLYNLDELSLKATQALSQRMAQTPLVEAIANETVADFESWAQQAQISPTIQRFKQALEHIRQEELARYLKNLTPHEADLLDRITGSLVQKIIKLPALELKAACLRGNASELSESLASLFHLDLPESEETPLKFLS
jgi:glutamyl-tRNA reductase